MFSSSFRLSEGLSTSTLLMFDGRGSLGPTVGAGLLLKPYRKNIFTTQNGDRGQTRRRRLKKINDFCKKN